MKTCLDGLVFVAATYKPVEAGNDRLQLTFATSDGYAFAILTMDEEERLLREILIRQQRARAREGVTTMADLQAQMSVDERILARVIR